MGQRFGAYQVMSVAVAAAAATAHCGRADRETPDTRALVTVAGQSDYARTGGPPRIARCGRWGFWRCARCSRGRRAREPRAVRAVEPAQSTRTLGSDPARGPARDRWRRVRARRIGERRAD